MTIHDVVDRIWHFATRAGCRYVGIGFDFSGTPFTPPGLDHVSKYLDLIQLLIACGAIDEQIRLLIGDNILHVWDVIERRAKEV